MGIKKGDRIQTPRFCGVTIEEVFNSKLAALAAGYTEPTYVTIPGWDVRGKSVGENRMEFAACKCGDI